MHRLSTNYEFKRDSSAGIMMYFARSHDAERYVGKADLAGGGLPLLTRHGTSL